MYSRAIEMSAFAISEGNGSKKGPSPASGETNLSWELDWETAGRGRAAGGEAGVVRAGGSNLFGGES